MKQVAQILGSGSVDVFDVPVPAVSDGFVLVRNRASLISAGTEKSVVDMGKKSLLQKARARPDQVRQVLKKIQSDGVLKTFQAVGAKLESLTTLGYSCSGTVVAVGGNVVGIRPGDRVACGGAGYANHAEFVAVPKNLVVKVPHSIDYEEAAFATVGAIALQGVRLAAPLIGETHLVIGLGLLGQIAVQLLRANGCNVVATDLDQSLVARAERYGAIGASAAILSSVCRQQTNGYGVDGVLVCAGSTSNSIIEICGQLTREKGRVVIVGAVKMDIPREPFFKKEISVVISRSYGPGRYDRAYEEDGHDYPIGYVRFTEQRNMNTVVQLIADRRLDVSSLVTHRFNLADASRAYSLIEGAKTEPYIGIVLSYPESELHSAKPGPTPSNALAPIASEDKICLGVFGAGGYATAMLLPLLAAEKNVSLTGVATGSGKTARAAAKQFGFKFAASVLDELLGAASNTILIASRHDSHANAVVRALAADKHVYVEKPLALAFDELVEIKAALLAHPRQQLMVGFNRRFAPATKAVLAHFAGTVEPLVVNIRVNAGHIPNDHWIQHPVVGGGRLLGEVCHFVDLAAVLVGSLPSKVHALCVSDNAKSAINSDNLCISLSFENGAIANIAYIAGGAKSMRKELIELFGGGRSAVIDDFRSVQLFSDDLPVQRLDTKAQDKGQAAMIQAWLAGLRSGSPCVATDALLSVSLATVLCVESLCFGMPMDVRLDLLDAKSADDRASLS